MSQHFIFIQSIVPPEGLTQGIMVKEFPNSKSLCDLLSCQEIDILPVLSQEKECCIVVDRDAVFKEDVKQNLLATKLYQDRGGKGVIMGNVILFEPISLIQSVRDYKKYCENKDKRYSSNDEQSRHQKPQFN